MVAEGFGGMRVAGGGFGGYGGGEVGSVATGGDWVRGCGGGWWVRAGEIQNSGNRMAMRVAIIPWLA